LARFSIVNPASFTNMAVVKVPDIELILSERMAAFVALWRQYDPPMAADYDVARLEFDPAKIIQEQGTAAHVNVLSRVNQAARAVTLAFATGTDLDGVASRYPGGVPRVASEIYTSTDSIIDRMVKDGRYRNRIWLAPNALASAGTAESYEFFGLTALPGARDVSATALRKPDEVVSILTVLMEGANPIPTEDQLLTVYRAINTEANMPMADVLSVQAARPITFVYNVDVWLHEWADKTDIIGSEDETVAPELRGGTIREALSKKIEGLKWLGTDHSRDDIAEAINQYGVHSAHILDFPGDVIMAGPTQFVQASVGRIRYRGRRS
jgi:phage-related baseplate assembly protein